MASKYAPVRRLLKSNPNLTPTQAARQLGLISDTQELQNKGRGRLGLRNRKADVDRKQNIADSTKPQSTYEKNRVKQRRLRNSANGKQTDHKVPVSLTGPQLRDTERRLGPDAAIEERDRLSEAYGGIGDEDGNLQDLTPEQNGQKKVDQEMVQRRLRDMEKENPPVAAIQPNPIDIDLSDFESAMKYAQEQGMNVIGYSAAGVWGTVELINAVLRFGGLPGP